MIICISFDNSRSTVSCSLIAFVKIWSIDVADALVPQVSLFMRGMPDFLKYKLCLGAPLLILDLLTAASNR